MPWASSSLPQAACEEDAPTVPRISSAANATVVRSVSTRGGRGSWCCRHSAGRDPPQQETVDADDDDFPFLPDQKPSESIAENASDSESELD